MYVGQAAHCAEADTYDPCGLAVEDIIFIATPLSGGVVVAHLRCREIQVACDTPWVAQSTSPKLDVQDYGKLFDF